MHLWFAGDRIRHSGVTRMQVLPGAAGGAIPHNQLAVREIAHLGSAIHRSNVVRPRPPPEPQSPVVPPAGALLGFARSARCVPTDRAAPASSCTAILIHKPRPVPGFANVSIGGRQESATARPCAVREGLAAGQVAYVGHATVVVWIAGAAMNRGRIETQLAPKQLPGNRPSPRKSLPPNWFVSAVPLLLLRKRRDDTSTPTATPARKSAISRISTQRESPKMRHALVRSPPTRRHFHDDC